MWREKKWRNNRQYEEEEKRLRREANRRKCGYLFSGIGVVAWLKMAVYRRSIKINESVNEALIIRKANNISLAGSRYQLTRKLKAQWRSKQRGYGSNGVAAASSAFVAGVSYQP